MTKQRSLYRYAPPFCVFPFLVTYRLLVGLHRYFTSTKYQIMERLPFLDLFLTYMTCDLYVE
jgi:hypothetical protein